FENNFGYSLNLTRENNKVAPLVDFLTRTRKGHCEYFATAAVLLLRQAGIPARYTFGYSAHEYNWMQENLVVRSRDAHAWAIAYVNGQWQNFDTTPSTWVDQQKENASSFEALFDIFSQAGFLYSYFRWGMEDENFQVYLLWLLIPPVLFLIWRIYSRTRLAQKLAETGGVSPAALYQVIASDFYLIESRLNQMGYAREEWETYSRWLKRIHRENPEFPVAGLAVAVDLNTRLRFDPEGLTPEEATRLNTEIQSWLNTPC
ncbi:MAG: transglutaminase domain-containing protein, partial [Nitrospinaceae bacterium]